MHYLDGTSTVIRDEWDTALQRHHSLGKDWTGTTTFFTTSATETTFVDNFKPKQTPGEPTAEEMATQENHEGEPQVSRPSSSDEENDDVNAGDPQLDRPYRGQTPPKHPLYSNYRYVLDEYGQWCVPDALVRKYPVNRLGIKLFKGRKGNPWTHEQKPNHLTGEQWTVARLSLIHI